MTRPGDWMKSVAFLAPAGHILAGFGLTLIVTFWVALTRYNLWPVEVMTGLLVVGIGYKEAVIDPKDETGEDLVSGFWDWLGWMGGMAITWGNIGLAHVLHIWPA